MKVVDFKDLLPREQGDIGVNLSQMLNKEILIKSVAIEERKRGQIAIITSANGEKYYTFSKIIIEQLNKIKNRLDGKIVVKATVRKKNNYYYLE